MCVTDGPKGFPVEFQEVPEDFQEVPDASQDRFVGFRGFHVR